MQIKFSVNPLSHFDGIFCFMGENSANIPGMFRIITGSKGRMCILAEFYGLSVLEDKTPLIKR